MKKKYLALMIALIFFSIGCVSQEQINTDNIKSTFQGQQYNWSTMDKGPYKDSISYATSTDLQNWTDSGQVLADHVSVPGAVYKDGEIYVYFVDVTTDGEPEKIGLLKSKDNGQTWEDKQIINIQGQNGEVPVDPAPLLLDDGRIRLFYFDIKSAEFSPVQYVYSAISEDGVNFTHEEGARFSSNVGFDPDVIEVAGEYRMYVGDLEGSRVISATSSDGLTFIKEGTAYTGGAVPDVFYNGKEYYLFTAGINIASSPDGIKFNNIDNRFQSTLGTMTADPSVIELSDGTYMMFYKFGA